MSLPYGATVLEHFRRPRNQRALERPTAAHEGYNPLCGDRVRIELKLIGETIEDAAFTANACAICTASASLLTERVSGTPISRAMTLTNEDVLASLGSELPQGRLMCAILPVRTLREALASFVGPR